MTTAPAAPMVRRRAGIFLFMVLLVLLLAILLIALLEFSGGMRLERRWSATPEDVEHILFTPDGKTLIQGGSDAVRMWDPATGKLLATIPIQDSCWGGIAISADGKLLAFTCQRIIDRRTRLYTLELWDLTGGGKRIATVDVPCYAIGLTFAPDGKTLALSTCREDGKEPRIEVRSVPSLAVNGTFPRPAISGELCFSPDGKRLASCEGDLQLLDPASGAIAGSFRAAAGELVATACFSSDGKAVHMEMSPTASTGDAEIRTWEVATGRMRAPVALGHRGGRGCFSADGRTFALVETQYGFGRSDCVEVWDVAAGQRIGKLTPRAFTSTITLSPDGKRLVVGFQGPGRRQLAPIESWRVR